MDDKCIKCENPTVLCLCTGKPIKNYYSKLAKYQNMGVARAKTIEIMEMLIGDSTLNSKDIASQNWFELEDSIVKIINSK